MPEFYCVIFMEGGRKSFTHPAEVAEGREAHYERARAEYGKRFVDVVYRNDPNEAMAMARDFAGEEQPF